jgi:hypothetical protein
MHGAGNDYVYVDCFAEAVPPNTSLRGEFPIAVLASVPTG